MVDNTETATLTLTVEQAEALRPLLERPERVEILVNFLDNMLAAKQVSKIVAWAFGIFLAVLAALYYISSILSGKSPHGAP